MILNDALLSRGRERFNGSPPREDNNQLEKGLRNSSFFAI
jgi:hypothetical protein